MNTVRIPADVDRADTLLAGLTARQLGYVAAGGLAAWTAFSTARALLPPPIAAALALPIVGLVAVLVVGRRDGLAGDRFLLAWLRHTRAPRRLVPAPDGVREAPPWAAQNSPAPAPLPFPVAGADQVLDLGTDGCALVCRATSVNFALRTADEQAALVGIFGRWLNSLTAPVEIVVRAERVHVDHLVTALADKAAALPHPALEAAARDHANFLGELARQRDVLRRAVLVVFREPGSGPDAALLLARRADEAATALAPAGVRLSPLDPAETTHVLAAGADPDATPRTPHAAGPDAIVSGAAA